MKRGNQMKLVKTKSSYEAAVVCGNCGKINKIEIPRGTYVESYIRKVSMSCNGCFMRLSHINIDVHPHSD